MKHIVSRFFLLFGVLFFVGAGCLSLTDSQGTSGPSGVFVSSDKGQSWKQISSMPTQDGVKSLASVGVFRLVDDPQDPKAMYWASRGNGLYFSYDEGVTWQSAKGELSTGFVYSVQVNPNDKCTLYATNGARVYRSEDCSRTWQEMYREDNTAARVNAIFVMPGTNPAVFMAKANGDVLKSTDNGRNWATIQRFGTNLATIRGDAVNHNIIYISSRENGLYRSTDAGATWIQLSDGLAAFPQALSYRGFSVHPTKENVLYWISTYGILRSDDAGASWSAYNLITSPGSADIYGFAVSPTNDQEMYYTTFNGTRSTFYRTSDGGKTWSTEKLPSGQIPAVLRMHPANGNVIYLGLTVPPKQ